MSSDFDYAGWVRRALDFHRARAERLGFEVLAAAAEAPLAARAADRLAGDLGRPLPAALRAFFERGAGGVGCGYRFDYDPDDEAETDAFLALFPHQTGISGGPRIGPAAALPALARGCAEWGPETLDAGDGPVANTAADVLPFMAVRNGDYVALDLRGAGAAADDPPVVYLAHDGEGARLADAFTGFLAAWERLAYLGPEVWLLADFRGPDGRLAPEAPAAGRLRALLGA